MKRLRIGIARYRDMKARTIAIARGEHAPDPEDPKMWFPSIESFSNVLSDKNHDLLAMIAENKPESLTDLSALSGRSRSDLSRTLRALAQYGFVHLKQGRGGAIIPRVPYSEMVLDLAIAAPDRGNAAAHTSVEDR